MEPHMGEASLPLSEDSIPPGELSSDNLESTAFSSQLRFTDQQLRTSQSPYNMASVASALPGLQHGGPYHPRQDQSQRDMSSGLTPASVYNMQQASHFPSPGNLHYADPAAVAAAQQRHYMPQHYGMNPRMMPIQTQGHPQMIPYGYGFSPTHYQNIDPRYGAQPGIPGYNMHAGMPTDQSYQRSLSESAPVPSFPRGPPRKPRQSGHALWVGNLPPSANVTDLKDHFSRDATKDIESVFLISKSNCAFVNYRSEASCVAAMSRFHDSRFGGVRLVCRLRRGNSTSSGQAELPTPAVDDSNATAKPNTEEAEKPMNVVASGPTIVGGPTPDPPNLQTESKPEPSTSLSNAKDREVEKYFVVKSLTLQDLEASVINGIWATQSHNEDVLNRAYESTNNVYLIFSANKSGEYFGYARMASAITGEPVKLGQASAPGPESEPATPTDGPRSIATAATATAPKGHIIDDSARGTIFWEADHSDGDGEGPRNERDQDQGQEWGKQFKVEWISTSRLPFYRTRGLRNPWNANREVKIARDGTELEPSIGRRLVGMFHRPSSSPNTSGMPLAQ